MKGDCTAAIAMCSRNGSARVGFSYFLFLLITEKGELLQYTDDGRRKK